MLRTEAQNNDAPRPTTLRLKPTDETLLAKLQRKLGLSRNGIIRLAIRRLAELEKV